MKKITFILPVKYDLREAFIPLDSLEKLEIPEGYFCEVDLFFSNPNLVGDFVSYSKQYSNTKVYLVPTDFADWSNLNILFLKKPQRMFVLQPGTAIEQSTLQYLVD